MAHNLNVKIATYNLHGLNQDSPLGDKRDYYKKLAVKKSHNGWQQ